MKRDSLRAVVVALAMLITSHAAIGSDESLLVELNKLEPNEGDCRAYLVLENGSTSAFESLKLDVVVFDTDGIVAKRLAVEGGPAAARKDQPQGLRHRWPALRSGGTRAPERGDDLRGRLAGARRLPGADDHELARAPIPFIK